MFAVQDFPPYIEKTFTIGRSESEPLVMDQHNNNNNNSGGGTTLTRKLKLAMLGCETKDPYGPLTHTAQLFIDMIGMASMKANELFGVDTRTDSKMYSNIVVRIYIFDAQKMEYPDDDGWDCYDGIIVPGSFSAAYDTDPWIEKLKQFIQTEIVANQRKTLGICFGHQVLAHSFSTTSDTTCSNNDNDCIKSNEFRGRAVATPSGPRAGRFHMPLTSAGGALLLSKSIAPNDNNSDSIAGSDSNNNTVQLYFTHGDMVEQIPNVAVILGGDQTVPIQAVAYFATSQEADQYRDHHMDTNTEPLLPLPYAVTMQAHPEYSTSIEMGIHRTLFQCMDAMERRQRPDSDIRSRDDAIQSFHRVQNDSIAIMARIGRLFGWF